MLARGGMAVVYLVHQPALDRDVVLKRLDLEGGDPALAQRFVREARLAATLDHPNIVTLFDFFEYEGVPYIAMEYVAGGSLRELIGRLDLPQVCGVVEGVLAGLGHAESHRIAHRDLKPENVLLTRRGSVKIADFGIARAVEETMVTQVGTVLGTLRYLAPEQAAGEPVGPAADVYSLGVVLDELCPDAPRSLLARMRDPDPRRRPSASEVAEELSETGTRYRAAVPRTRIAALAVALALVVLVIVVAAWPRHHAQTVEPVPHSSSAAQQARNLEAWLRRYSR